MSKRLVMILLAFAVIFVSGNLVSAQTPTPSGYPDWFYGCTEEQKELIYGRTRGIWGLASCEDIQRSLDIDALQTDPNAVPITDSIRGPVWLNDCLELVPEIRMIAVSLIWTVNDCDELRTAVLQHKETKLVFVRGFFMGVEIACDRDPINSLPEIVTSAAVGKTTDELTMWFANIRTAFIVGDSCNLSMMFIENSAVFLDEDLSFRLKGMVQLAEGPNQELSDTSVSGDVRVLGVDNFEDRAEWYLVLAGENVGWIHRDNVEYMIGS